MDNLTLADFIVIPGRICYNRPMRKGTLICICLLFVLALGCGSNTAAPSATPAPAVEATSSPNVTPKPTVGEQQITLTFPATASPTPAPTFTPSPTPVPLLLEGVTIGVDPGHQRIYDPAQEPIAPNSSKTKAKVSGGTRGVTSRVYEYEVNLSVGLLLRDLLEDAGATVVMTHESLDVSISNKERAELFNANKVDLGIRLHCNNSDNRKVRGAFMLIPTEGRTDHYEENLKAARCILESYLEETGLTFRYDDGITERSDQTGFNWCTRPIVCIEMGHMTNSEEDLLLTDTAFQHKMALGIFNGIVAYFTGDTAGNGN